jgi:hypothetical protein
MNPDFRAEVTGRLRQLADELNDTPYYQWHGTVAGLAQQLGYDYDSWTHAQRIAFGHVLGWVRRHPDESGVLMAYVGWAYTNHCLRWTVWASKLPRLLERHARERARAVWDFKKRKRGS